MRFTIESTIKASSIAIALLGLVVILGWHLGVVPVVQLHPAFAPMQYNTAVCFLLAGVAAMYACTRFGVAGILGIVVAAIGLVSLLQYAVGLSFGIDELLMDGYVTVATSHAGRMAPQTAIGFVLAGSALAMLTLGRALPRATLAADVLGSVIGGFGVAVVVGYGAGLESAYGWVETTQVALHTACGFVLLSWVIVLNSWRLNVIRGKRQPVLAIPVAVGALAVTLVLSQAQLTWQVERIDSATARDVERATAALEERLRGHIEKFGALAAAWSRSGGGPQPTWEADVARFLRDQQVFLAVSHVEAGKLDWIFPSAPYPAHLGFDYSGDERRSAFLAAARERGGALLTESLPLKSGRAGVLLVAPLTRTVGDGESFVIAAALLDDLFRPTALGIPAHRLAVFEGDRLVYGSEAELGERTMRARELRIGGMSLRLAATPLPETIESLRSPLPAAVFASGLLASVLLVVTAHLAQVSSRRAADLAVANASLKAVKDKLERLALFDDLTALGNRNLLLMELDKRLDVARRDRLPLPLLLIDLNGFKAVNDTFGHQAGDDVLREFAARLMDSLAVSSDAFRTGGDEFAVLAKPGTSLDEAIIIAREIEDMTRKPFVVGGEQRVIGASIGIASYPRHGEERLRLLRAADVAMYLAKHTATGIEIASDDAPTGVLRALKQSQLLR